MTFAQETQTQAPRLAPRFVPLLPKRADVPGMSLLLSGLRSPFALSVSASSALDTRRSMCSPGGGETPVSPDDVAAGGAPRKKRPRTATHASECDSNEADDETDDDRYPRPPVLARAGSTDLTDAGGCPERKRAKQQKWRKPTYLVRKEERDVLLSEIRALEAKVEFLRRHAGLSPVPTAANEAPSQQTLVDTELHNNLLRESMRNQQLQLLSAQSAMSELAMHSLSKQCPLATAIRLRRDWALRRETLVALKHDKLRDARLLLDKRTQFLQAQDEVRETFEQAHFITARGDLCVLHFDVVPVEGVGSVQQAFAAVQGYMQSVQQADSQEESNNVIHDHQGHAAADGGVHPDDDSGSILHRRVLISGEELPCEANFVVFSELTAGPSAANCAANTSLGTVAFDFVDEDELYPYRPHDFMRQDVTGAINVAMRARKCPVTGGQESVLVLTRWVFVTVHRDGRPIPAKALEDARIRISRTSDEMVHAVRTHSRDK